MPIRRPTRAQLRNQSGARQWWLVVYRVPSEPGSRRVAVWRDLKRIGALYLQQCVCILPQIPSVGEELAQLLGKIPKLGGEVMRFDLAGIAPADEARIIEAFRTLRSSEYAEIIEECETKFVKEIEFEHFRQNYTYEEAEEIRQDLEKIRRWFKRVQSRDWFGAERAHEVAAWLERCQTLLAEFEEAVYQRQPSDASLGGEDGTLNVPEAEPAASIIRLASPRKRKRSNG